jgi:hypothetical protein
LLLAPRSASSFAIVPPALRGRSASGPRPATDEASGRVGNAVDELARKGTACDDVAESVARGAHEVERFAVSVKSDNGESRG